MISEDRRIYTVSELNLAVKALLESDYRFLELCVRGELSNYKIYPSGHHYFTLKDAEGSLRCVMFRQSAQKLRFRPENGMQVCVTGSLKVYPRDGAYQLYASDILPEGTGDLQLAFEQLKRKLYEEGLFDAAHRKALPAYPKRIALITSSAGAAVRDMIRILRERWPLTEVLVMPVRVQGTEAPAEIVGAIRYANRWQVADLIITGRGGGSLEDLWAFNDERVARAIFASEIPVISAVGHEPDVTISDFVADRRASTPSNAAEIAVPAMPDVRAELLTRQQRMTAAMDAILERCRGRLDTARRRPVLTDAGTYVDLRRLETDRLQERLAASQRQILMKKRNMLTRESAALDAMSPLKVLGRGYAIATDAEGRTVRSVRALENGQRLRLRLSDGQADCLVEHAEVEECRTRN